MWVGVCGVGVDVGVGVGVGDWNELGRTFFQVVFVRLYLVPRINIRTAEGGEERKRKNNV